MKNVDPILRSRPKTTSNYLWTVGIIAVLIVAAAGYLTAIRRNLPYLPIWDEPTFVRPAVRMASTNSLNPLWFSHPGSTVIYPLAVLYRFSNFADEEGLIFCPPPEIAARFRNHSADFYLSGRILMTLYALGGIYVGYLAGRLLGGGGLGVLAGWMVFLSPMIMGHANIVRTDSASLFFSLIAVYMFLRLLSFQRSVDHLLAGAAVGLAIATKYSLGPLAIVLIALEVVLVSKDVRCGRAVKTAKSALIGLAVVPVVFLLATPYFLFQLDTVLGNLRSEMRTEHLGQDGLTPWGNLWWYLGREIPRDMGWWRLGAALVGLVVAILKRDHKVLLCAGTALVLLAGISAPALHWGRWLVPVLPLLYLLAAYGVISGFRALERIGLRSGWNWAVLVGVVALLSYQPAGRLYKMIRRYSNYATPVRALKWVEENIPPGSCLVQEWWTFQDYPVRNIRVIHEPVLASRTIGYYADSACRYLLTNSGTYDNFLADPERYPQETAFYLRLFQEAECLAEFAPSKYVTGPTIRIYRFPRADD